MIPEFIADRAEKELGSLMRAVEKALERTEATIANSFEAERREFAPLFAAIEQHLARLEGRR